MSKISTVLAERCQNQCELCGAGGELSTYIVPPKTGTDVSEQVALCPKCLEQVGLADNYDLNHLRCLNDSMWNPEPAVQVLSNIMLKRIDQDWSRDALDMMYMEESTQTWAAQALTATEKVVHKDSNGNILSAGDTVSLIQDLNVKGGGFTAKRGTSVRRIRLVPDNAEHIEGKVDGQNIVILTKYVKKQ